ASLTIGATSSDPSGSSVGAGVVTGGAGGGGNSFSGAGAAYGSGIFLDGMTSGGGDGVEKLTLGAGQIAGQTTTISGIIADEAGSVQGAAGQGELVIEGQGTVKLAPVDSKGAATANTFVGGILLEGGTLELASSGAAGAGALTFVNDAKLVIDGTAMPANLISGFAAGDVIDLTGVAFTDETATLDSSDALHFTENGQTYTLQFDAAAAGLSFSATSDGAAGTDITVACYGAGTRIRTGRGEVAVEDLRVGDMALTAGGGRRPIGWIGWRELDVTRHPDPRAVRPVRIAAGAFGDLKPRRDLWLSPGHNVFVDGVLIPAIVLANGATIEQVSVEKVVYYHVELDAHDIVLAESYLDCGNRDAFANGGGATELFPDFAPRADRATCCPICKTGPKVEAAKARLLARAQDFGFAATRDPDLHLLADGARIEPDRIEGRRYAFSLSGHVKDIRLASRVWTPSHMRSDSADDRDLGVLATRLAIDGAPRDLTALADGWREVESASWRWTDGFARLPAGARTIVIEIGDDPFYWTDRSDATALLFGFVAGARGLRAV
ncbi:Hint domain-containing protein, partial [Rhodoblastus sphagnicola]